MYGGLSDTTFTGKKDKHNLIISALEVKPAYTLALKELIWLIKDDLLASEIYKMDITEAHVKCNRLVHWSIQCHWCMLLPEY